jgi:hypothetical protein
MPRAAPVHAAEQTAILVPVSNPEGVADLIELALAATPLDAPPPHVLALVKPPPGGVRSGLREAEQRVPPRSPALSKALEHAVSRDRAIRPQAVWSDNPASDILNFARHPEVGWLLLGSHRAVFGSDYMGGVVREILEKARDLPIHVAVMIHGGERPLDRIFAVVDRGPHGRATLDLAVRVAQRLKSNLHAVVMPTLENEADTELLDMIREAGRVLGRRLPIDVLTASNAVQLARQTPGGLVIIAANLADKVGLSPDGFADGKRSVVVVQGSGKVRAKQETGAAERPRNVKP